MEAEGKVKFIHGLGFRASLRLGFPMNQSNDQGNEKGDLIPLNYPLPWTSTFRVPDDLRFSTLMSVTVLISHSNRVESWGGKI